MPNWCNNMLVIDGQPERLRAFMEKSKVGEDAFTFSGLVPRPEDIGDGWYDWSNENWGTKWEPNVNSIDDDDDYEVVIQFETAWGPPGAYVKTVAAMYPDLTFSLSYAEPGMGFGGVMTLEGGVVVDSKEAQSAVEAANLSEWHEHQMGLEDADDVSDPDEDEDEEEE